MPHCAFAKGVLEFIFTYLLAEVSFHCFTWYNCELYDWFFFFCVLPLSRYLTTLFSPILCLSLLMFLSVSFFHLPLQHHLSWSSWDFFSFFSILLSSCVLRSRSMLTGSRAFFVLSLQILIVRFLLFFRCKTGELFDYMTEVVSLSEKRTRFDQIFV